VTWQATATDTNSGAFSYRFSVARAAAPLMIVRDYEASNTFAWTPAQYDGWFRIQVTARNNSTQATAVSVVGYQVTSLASATQAVVSATAHPLVALYSAPPCPVGSSIFVEVWRAAQAYSQYTSVVPCQAGTSMNFYLAGMRASTTYQLNHEVITGSKTTVSRTLSFTTGSIPASIQLPNFDVLAQPTGQSSLTQDILLHSYTLYYPRAVATDFLGNVTWYNPSVGILQRPVTGGTMLLTGSDGSDPMNGRGQLLREIDLAGNVVRETTASRISEQLAAMGEPQAIDSFNHEAVRLPNGDTAVLASLERVYPAGTQGSTAPVDILGNIVLILDQNWQLVWFWNAFDHLDVSRTAILGEICTNTDPGCPPLALTSTANDWLHANSINYIPADGNLIVSLRNQDWVVKIDYSNGNGTGNVLWRLGMQGDFKMNSSDPYPWFTHQHDATYENGGTSLLSVYDNGNTRVAQNPGLTENSRGQVLQLDETNFTASLVVNVDLAVYSAAFGSVQLLANGGYNFMSGWLNPGLFPYSIDLELSAAGVAFNLESIPAAAYRSFRMSSFYNP